jgi:hypothetical protein
MASFPIFPPFASLCKMLWICEWKCLSLLLCPLLELAYPHIHRLPATQSFLAGKFRRRLCVAERALRVRLYFWSGGALSEREGLIVCYCWSKFQRPQCSSFDRAELSCHLRRMEWDFGQCQRELCVPALARQRVGLELQAKPWCQQHSIFVNAFCVCMSALPPGSSSFPPVYSRLVRNFGGKFGKRSVWKLPSFWTMTHLGGFVSCKAGDIWYRKPRKFQESSTFPTLIMSIFFCHLDVTPIVYLIFFKVGNLWSFFFSKDMLGFLKSQSDLPK